MKQFRPWVLASGLFIAMALGAGASEIPSLPPFLPSGNYTPLTATTGGATATLPTGSPQAVIYNLGDFDAIVKLGGSGVTPAAVGDVVRAHGFSEMSIGAATTIAAETLTGSSALIVSTGSGELQAGGAPNTISDAQSQAFQGAVAMIVGTAQAAQRSVGVLATAPGNVEFQFGDSSTLTLPVYVGWKTYPFAATEIVGAGTTATATYFNLK
jgi:hypothetical protein